MAVSVNFETEGSPFYVVAISDSEDSVNRFFRFNVILRFDDDEDYRKLKVGMDATLTIGALTYECEIVSKSRQLITTTQQASASGNEAELELRPAGWTRMQKRLVRVFEVSEGTEDPLNIPFAAQPTTQELNRLLNVALFEEDLSVVETIAETEWSHYSIDWWQNQLLLQLQESNAALFQRLIWKMSSCFFYGASQGVSLWLVAPKLFKIPESRTTLTEQEVTQLSVTVRADQRPVRWYLDQQDQISQRAEQNNVASLGEMNKLYQETTLNLVTTTPLSCDQVFEYSPERKEHSQYTFIPTSVRHRFDHRNGYTCECSAYVSPSGTHFDLSSHGQPPEPFNQAIVATVYAEEEKAMSGERDQKMRYRIQLDFSETIEGVTYTPKTWVYRIRDATSFNGAGDYSPLPTSSKVVVQMLNGDREQPVMTGTFTTKHGRRPQ